MPGSRQGATGAPEFDQFRPDEDLQTVTREHFTLVTADIRFDKTGKEIFRTPGGPEGEDYDWPNLVGGKIIHKVAAEAARKAKLRITKDLRIFIQPNEKGWVEVGYQFLHKTPTDH